MSKYYSSSIAFGAEQTKTEKVVVSTTKIGDVTTDAVSGALTVDEVPTLNSLNPVSSDGVARAVIQAGAELPTRGSSDTGKVLTVANSDGDLEWDEPAEELPDMSGNDGKILGAVDNNGTMEARWVNPPDSYPTVAGNANKVLTVNSGATGVEWANVPTEVPEVTSNDDAKVLTASYSGGQGSYSWQTAQGGGSSYTSSAPIAIESDVIKLKYTDNFAINWKWKPVRVTGFDSVTTYMSSSGIVTKCQVPSPELPYIDFFTSYYPFVLTVDGSASQNAYIPTSGETTTKWTIVLYKQGSPSSNYAIATETYAYARVSGNNYYMFDGTTSSFTFSFNSQNIHGDLSNTPLCLAFIPSPADNVTASGYWNTPMANLYNAGWQRFYTPTGPVDSSVAPRPGVTPKDSLSIESLPNTVVDQTFSATSLKPQSGVAVASAVNTGVAAAIDDAVDVDTDNVVLSGDGDSVKIEFTRVTDTSTTVIEHTNLTGTTNTAQASSWWCCNLVFDLDSVNKTIDAGSDPLLKITSSISVASDTTNHPTSIGFSNDTTSISNYWSIGAIRESPLSVQDISIKSKVSYTSTNTLRYLVVQIPAPSNTEASAQELAATVASAISIEGWPVDGYGTKVVIPALPDYSSADAGRVLQVQNDGTLAWVTLS